MKPELSCCDPERVPFPSGWAWAHSSACAVNPRQKVAVGEDHPSHWRGMERGRGRSTWWTPQPYRSKAAEVIAFRAHTGRWRG